jgi:hypothetical protein
MKNKLTKKSENNESAMLVETTISEIQQQDAVAKKSRRKLKLVELPETGEVEISVEATAKHPARRIRFPKESFKRFRLRPEQFKRTQRAVDAWNLQCRKRAVYTTSLEGRVGYNSLFRVMQRYLSEQIAYYRSVEGGSLSFEEARERTYSDKVMDEAAFNEAFDSVMTIPVDWISFSQLWELARDSPATAENVWEWIKQHAADELTSGHLAADALEPIGKLKEAWTRAKYVAIRESFCNEYKPKGGIELSMIDLLAQSYFMVQYWTKELSQRTMTEPRRLPYEYQKQVEWQKKANPRGWEEEKWNWEVPTIGESAAIEQAAQMLDRFQRMYFRALRQLRDWRRYAPAVTINNPKQVNIAADGGQQINVKSEK